MGKASILIDDRTKTDLEREARLTGSTTSSIAEMAIDAYLRRRSAKREAIESSIAEADTGVFVSQEAMDRWVGSWGSAEELPEPEADVFLQRDR